MGHVHSLKSTLAGMVCLSFSGCGDLATAQRSPRAAGETVSLTATNVEMVVDPARSKKQSDDSDEEAVIHELPTGATHLAGESAVAQELPEKGKDTVKKPKPKLPEKPKEAAKQPRPGPPSLGEFRSRNHTVTIHSGEKELLFTITSADGKVLAAELSVEQLERDHPELFRIYESAVGGLWGGR